jgi:hypothetical protein
LRQGVNVIRTRTDLLADVRHRESFLVSVPSHRQLLALARELEVTNVADP